MQRVAGRMGSNCTTRVHVRVVDDRTGQDSEYVQGLETRRGGDATRTRLDRQGGENDSCTEIVSG